MADASKPVKSRSTELPCAVSPEGMSGFACCTQYHAQRWLTAALGRLKAQAMKASR